MREETLHRIFQDSAHRRKGVSGPGDDCARLRPPAGRELVQTVDQVIGGVHLELDAPPAQYAVKLLRRCLSDLAAAGATPWALSWTLALPKAWASRRIGRLARAFLAEAEQFDLPVVGGDCSQSDTPVLTCTALGLSNGRVPGRAGLRDGDVLLVSGRLGAAISSGEHLRPQPRLELGRRLVERFSPHAMMDLSDGLLRDLPRMLRASGCGARIDLEDLPLHDSLKPGPAAWESALSEGEDYELLVGLSPRQAQAVLRGGVAQAVGMQAIGTVHAGRGVQWRADGKAWKPSREGWDYRWEGAK